MAEISLKLNWKLAKDGAGFRCETPNGLGITIHPLARDRYLEWSWIAYYDAETFEADNGTCMGRNMAIKEALDALKLPCDGCGIPA
jgi:hypothetical protein